MFRAEHCRQKTAPLCGSPFSRVRMVPIGVSVPDTPRDPDPNQILEELESLQRALSDSQADQQRGERLEVLGNLSGMIAHEVRGIASKIVGNAQLIARDADDPDRARLLSERIVRLGLHAGRVAEAILAAADEPIVGNAGVLEIHRHALDALPSEARSRIDDAGVDPMHRVAVDPDALERVLVNLYLNAWRAVGGSGGTGRIRVSSSAACGSSIEITVRDDGPGMPRDLGESVFEPWSRGATHSQSGSGHGLGLALCRHLVESVGGSIRLGEPMPDRGAEVALTLPMVDGQRAPTAA